MDQIWPREPQGRELEGLTQLFKALGDPSRVKILFQIGISEACVSDVADRLNMSESAVYFTHEWLSQSAQKRKNNILSTEG